MANRASERTYRADARVQAALAVLVRSAALSEEQAKLLSDRWGQLDDDWGAQPWFREIRDHTRFVIDVMRTAKRLPGN